MSWITRLVPSRLSTPLARHAVPLVVGSVGILLLVAIAATALVSPGMLGVNAARFSDEKRLDDAVAGLSELDSDKDGLSDALENYVYGTDPANWDSSGMGIPDGWLVQYRFDPLDPLTRTARGRAPPAELLPAAYADGYPLEYRPPLKVYYEYAKPAGYRPGVDEPWWRGGAEHADPIALDQTGTGIPTGWIIAHGLPLRGFDPSRIAQGSEGNLTIREAWEHNTNPMLRDSDKDGLDDWVEIHTTKTDPSKFSTAGVGIADGWLLRYGLDPFDPDVATQDLDRDGLTNYEEFVISVREFGSQGLATVIQRGLNPLDWQTAQTGIPDGWYVRYELSPFGGDVDTVIGRASDHPEYRTWVPEGFEPLPDITFTVRGAYEYARPSDWNESTKGVWWGGTNPKTGDSDGDGLPDAIEIRGWYANVTFDTGPDAKPRVYLATSNPLEPDSDGDGLTDVEEYRGRSTCGGADERVFPFTDPRNRDTAFSGLSDYEKVCGVVRGDAKYEVAARGSAPGLDPTKADSAGDHLKDGARVDFWHERYESLRANPRYPYNGSAYRTVFEWTEKYARFGSLTREQTLAQFRPDGDVDADGIPNVADADPSGGLFAEKFDAPGTPRTKVYFLGGPQIDPAVYRFTEFASPVPHTATDPANPDTDGDGLPDAWEIRYGRFDPAAGVWDLDPAKQDSDGDGITDDKANNDNDVVTWYAFDRRGSSTERSTRTFVFDNRMEFLAGTDPNELSTAGDGVPDGWKAFWGSRITTGTYPNLIGARDPSVGSVALDAATEIEEAIVATGITPTSNLRNLGAKATGYVRLVNVSACGGDLSSLLKPGERIADVNPCFSGTNLDNQPVRAARIYGVKTLTYADEARLRTNPYMADTDGDGAPDAYEAYFLVRTPAGNAYPDPVADDGARDADGDGLGVRDECGSADGRQCGFETFRVDGVSYGAGADPNAADTDGDGIQDGIEAGALINPLDPSDVESFARADQDSDQDGLPDFVELTGKDSKTYFGEPIRTNPKDPDTDGDGLLDGDTRNLNPLIPAHAALIAEWSARGIAHNRLPNGTYDFLGERPYGALTFGMRPDVLDSALPGIPDGWLAYYNQNPKQGPVDADLYKLGRPSWWNERAHGVWWWGARPGVAIPDDADGDGLHDRNGEDPFPGFNRLNLVVDGNLTLRDPAALEAWVKGVAGPENQRLRAQRIGDGAGDPRTAREAAVAAYDPATNVLYRDMRACVAVIDVDAPSVVNKGESFNVSGRVVLNERAGGVCGSGNGALLHGTESARVGVPNRSVLVSVFTPDAQRVVGAGFTDANGSFTIRANVTSRHVFPIPQEGLALLGSVSGAAVSEFDTTLLGPGERTGLETNRLVVWVYNTSSTVDPAHPQHEAYSARVLDRNGVARDVTVNATRFAVSAPAPITVKSATRIVFDVDDSAVNGQKLRGELRLLDAGGGAVSDMLVVLRWEGATSAIEFRNLSTDRAGRINLTNLGIPVGVRAADTYVLSANFTSSDPNLLSSSGAFGVRVRHPTNFTATLDATAVTVGETLSISGSLERLPVLLPDGTTLPGAPFAEAPITASVGGVEETAQSDANGRFTLRLAVPGSVAAGRQALVLRTTGDDAHAPTQMQIPLDVKRTAEIVGLNRLEGPRSIEVTLRGRLIDNAGQGFGGTIQVESDIVGILARGIAQNTGEFSIVVPLHTLPLGSQPLRVAFAGDVGHAPASNITLALVTSVTRLNVTEVPAVVVRGEPVPVVVRVTDDEGAAVPQQPVAIYWRGAKAEVRVTDASGAVTFLLPTNVSERPSIASLGAEFTPAPNSVYQPTSAAREVRVVAGVSLTLEERSVARGPVAIGGRLVDDEGRPLPGSAVAIALDGVPLGEARVARNGTFELQHVLPDATPLGAHRVSATFEGATTLARTSVNATWHVRSPLALELTALSPLVRGERATFDGLLTDDRGLAVDAPLRVFLAGRDMGEFRTSNGKLAAALNIPADVPRGETTLRIFAPQSERYEAFTLDVPVVVKIRPKVEVELPSIAFRGFAVGGGVTLKDDQGAPLRNTSYAYQFGTGRDAVTGVTDAEGTGSVAGVAPVSGSATLALTVRGGPDVVSAQYTTADMRVVGPATPIGYAALLLVVLVVLGIAALVVAAVMLRRRQLVEARTIVDEAIRDLLAGNEYAGTIFLAYRRFAAFLARHGFAEKASDTPREFALGVRKALPIGAVPLRALIGLFEEARYSDHPIGSPERDRAVQALGEVRAELDKMLGQRKEASA